ncbi:MAG: SDR family oxidoreductase [Candidatus Sungbacteria bacterium]|nr:SDR family oxidoreductase [Candidatus Sungbacteria bacterium]
MDYKAHVLIPGGAGYVGSVLTEHLLDSGYRVTVLDNLYYQQRSLLHVVANPLFDFVFGDVRDEALLKNLLKDADVIIPLAAVVGAPACDRNPELARSLNFEAIRLLNKLRDPKQLVVFPATDSGYGIKPGNVLCTEDSPLGPISLYAKTKVDAEAELLNSPNAITLRLSTVFGVSPRIRMDLLVNHFTYAAASDRYLVIFEKDFKRNFVHVRDVANAFIFAIENAPRMVGRPHNIGLDEANITKEELAYKIKQYVPDLFLHFADVGSDPDKRNYTVSHERMRGLGFEAKRSLDFGIQELLKAYKTMKGHSAIRNI